jgi:hypothetical protein
LGLREARGSGDAFGRNAFATRTTVSAAIRDIAAVKGETGSLRLVPSVPSPVAAPRFVVVILAKTMSSV